MLPTRINKILLFFKRSNPGFSLIEIVIVIGILGLILGAIYPFLNTINRWGGVSQNDMQQFEDSVNNYFLSVSKKLRNANTIDIYSSDGSVSSEGNRMKIVLDSGLVTYQINNNSIEVIDSSTKKVVPNVTNITIDSSTPLFKDLTTNKRKNIELNVKITYSVGTVISNKIFTSSVTMRKNKVN